MFVHLLKCYLHLEALQSDLTTLISSVFAVLVYAHRPIRPMGSTTYGIWSVSAYACMRRTGLHALNP